MLFGLVNASGVRHAPGGTKGAGCATKQSAKAQCIVGTRYATLRPARPADLSREPDPWTA
jgi:hypothetical protein